MSGAISGNLVRLRKKHRLSQRSVAESLGISQPLLSHYERGIREGGVDFIVRAADFYGVSCDVLLGRATREDELDGLLYSSLPLEGDKRLSLATVARAAAALNPAREDENSALTRALALLLLRAAGGGGLDSHWLAACIEELLSEFSPAESNSPALQTVRAQAMRTAAELLRRPEAAGQE